MNFVALRFIFISSGLLIMALCTQAQPSKIDVSLVIEGGSFPEHFPIPFKVEIANNTSHNVELSPYNIGDLPNTVLAIDFESASVLPKGSPGLVETGAPNVTIQPDKTIILTDYLQDYLQDLKPGKYEIPWHLRWEYVERGGAAAKQIVAFRGMLDFTVTNADPAQLNSYISRKLEVVQSSTDPEAKKQAAIDLSLISDPAVVPALLSLKSLGYEFEVLNAARRLPKAAASHVLIAVATESQNPGNVREALDEMQRRGVQLPGESLSTLLSSENKWIVIEAIEYAARAHRREFLISIEKLADANDADVRAAAKNASGKLGQE